MKLTLAVYKTSNVTIVTEVQSTNARLFAGMWRPLVSVITTLYYVATKHKCTFVCRYVMPPGRTLYYVATISFHRRVWYRVLSLHYPCIQSSGIILIP